MVRKKYTPQIEKFLIGNAEKITVEQAEKKTGINKRVLWRKVKLLGVKFKSRRSWLAVEDKAIVDGAGVVSAEDLAAGLGRTVNAVRERSRVLKVSLSIAGARGPKRNPVAVEWVLWAGRNAITWEDLIVRCGVAKTTIYRIAGDYNVNLKIKKSAATKEAEKEQLIQDKKQRRKEIMANNSFLYAAWS